jgi:hypothetical protein
MTRATITLIGGPTALIEVIVPVHHDGGAHFTQSGHDLERAFGALSIGPRLRLVAPGVPTAIELQ